ncbi:MAG: hypothetical protein EOP24_31940 [Hyphomicrobiales bacterium]|nr:MAG: hypothetical protein EOP24_31940 [Hyphomicrobiales bacterium]
MPLIVAPTEGFDSLISLADAAAYMAKMGHTWAGDDSAKAVDLRQATQYVLSAYSVRPEFLDPVRANLAAACCEAALRASTGRLFEDVAAQHVTSVKVGPIQREMSAPANGGQRRFAVIDALMRGMTQGAGMVRLVRA